MSSMDTDMNSSSVCPQALSVDVVLDQIFTHLKRKGDNILKYRSLCHKWNDIIVQILNKSRQSFKIPLRYGPQVPWSIVQSEALCFAEETLKNTMDLLTGTAGRLVFDTVVIDRDFYLAGVTAEWTNFLNIQGKWIRHIQLHIRSGESPKEFENHVTDVAEVVSVENIRAIFCSSPNLESLHFCVGFSNYLTQRWGQVNSTNFSLYPAIDIPRLNKLINICIQEPLGTQYTCEFINEILSMAPNLSVLNIEPRNNCLSEFTSAMKFQEAQLKGSMTSLGFRNVNVDGVNADMHLKELGDISFLQLTSLELRNIYGDARNMWLDMFLKTRHNNNPHLSH